MKARIVRHRYLAAGAIAMLAAIVGCGSILDTTVGDQTTAPIRLTERVAPSLLVAVPGPADMDQLLSRLVTATARPSEDLEMLEAAARGHILVDSESPPPASVYVPGQPAAPGPGASSYQDAHYQRDLTHWRGRVAVGQRTVAARTQAADEAWIRNLRLQVVAAGSPSSPQATDLPEECALVANVVSGMIGQASQRFGARRVILLFTTSLSGMPSAGELNGNDVIVIASYLPTAAAASGAQLNLLNAGARSAAVLGPEITATQVDQLISEGLSQREVTEDLSGRALFANDSAALLPGAVSVLAPIVAELRQPGATGVINGYASAPGGFQHNLVLSQDRAAAVAAFLEARGVPKSSLLVVGHGASDLVAPGWSGDNRRVVVVIEELANGTF